MSKTTLLAFLLIVIISTLVYLKNSKSEKNSTQLKGDSVILAFGDSLTYGFGANEAFSYPQFMQNRTGLQVINAGINGELSSEGLERLPTLLEHNPDLVILCHGGNDILNKVSPIELKDNLLQMIELIKLSGAEVLLVGVPDFGLFGFSVHEVYEEVADETDVLYEDEVLTKVEKDNSLKSDYVHPNAKGYEMMADAFIEILGL